MSETKTKNVNIQRKTSLEVFSGSSANRLPENDFEEILGRLKIAFGVETDTDLAKSLDLRQGAVSNAKQKRTIPPSWITTVALTKDISADWLLTGEGNMKREGKKFGWTSSGIKRIDRFEEESVPAITGTETCIPDDIRKAAIASQVEEPALYNGQQKQGSNIADLVSKTIEVLQSGTVFQTALESNIEAFHHAIVLDKKIDQVEERIMSKVSARLDGLEAENKHIHAENKQLHDETQQLRQELEHARAQSKLSDTG